jgi:hypothetical protein
VARQPIQLANQSLDGTLFAITDDQGRYRFEPVPPGYGYRLSVFPRTGLADHVRELDLKLGPNEVDVVLARVPSGSLGGTVETVPGEPLAGLELSIRSSSARGWRLRAKTDARGGFHVERVPAGDITIESGSRPRIVVDGFAVESGKHRQVRLRLGIGTTTVSGRAVTSTGEPLRGARVIVSWRSSEATHRAHVDRATVTDAAGRFEVAGLARGRCMIDLVATGFRASRTAILVPADRDPDRLTVRLERSLGR